MQSPEIMNLLAEPASTIPYIESKGIRILKDEMVTLEGEFSLSEGLTGIHSDFTGKRRLPLG